MTANPAPERPAPPTDPVEPTDPVATPTPSIHDRHIGTIAAWLAKHSTTDLVVEVVTGPNRTQVARGRYVDMEAHPSATGVYRLVFDNSKAGPEAPPGEQWVAVGHELVDVAAGDTSLIIDKGSQRIEIHVAGAQVEPPTITAAPTPPVAGVEPATPAARAAEASVLEAYAPAVEALATAPVYQNAAIGGSRLYGETRLEVVGDELRVTARRMRHGTAFFVVCGVVLAGFAIAGVMLYGLARFNVRFTNLPADEEYLRTTMYGTLAVAAAGLLFYLVGRLISAGRHPETIVAPLAAVSGRRYRRTFVLRGPFGREAHTRKLVLKAAGKADRATLREVIDLSRAGHHR